MFSTVRSRYRCAGSLGSHRRNQLSALAFAPSGAWLASAADTELIVWDLGTMTVDFLFHALPSPVLGSVTCLAWLNDSTVAAGTSKGWISVVMRGNGTPWSQVYVARTSSKQLVCMRSDVSADGAMRLLTGGDEGIVQRWAFDPQHGARLSVIFSVKVEVIVVMALRFGAWGGEESVIVFSRDDGRMYALRPDTGEYVAHVDLNAPIGAADIGNGGKVVIHSDTGFKVFPPGKAEVLHENLILDSVTQPIQVAFVENGKRYVTGSERGVVTIFDGEHGDLVDEFTHSQDGLINVLAVHERNGETLIACGSSASKSVVSVWKRTRQHRRAKNSRWSLSISAAVVVSLLATAACGVLAVVPSRPAGYSLMIKKRDRTGMLATQEAHELTQKRTEQDEPSERALVVDGGDRQPKMKLKIDGRLYDVYQSA